MWRFTTPVALGISLAEFDGVSESLALETAHGVGDEDVDVVFDVTSEQSGWQSGGLEGQDEEAGVAPLTVSEGGQSPHV